MGLLRKLLHSNQKEEEKEEKKEKTGKKEEKEKVPDALPGPWTTEEELFSANVKARAIRSVGPVLSLKAASLYCTPPSLCGRTELVELDLSVNPIKEHFSKDMTKLTNLKSLVLTECYFKSVPKVLGRMLSLTSLNLSSNNIENSYSILGALTNLEELNLENCNLQNFENMDNLVSLQRLNLSRNKLSGSIKSIESLKNLKFLEIRNSCLKSFQVDTKGLNCLEMLDAKLNSLSDLNGISDIISLKTLFVSGNYFQDISTIGNLSHLENLELGSLSWDLVPETFVDLISLQTLNCSFPLGVLNSTLFKLQNLTEISLNFKFDFSSTELIGCTVLKLSDDVFDLSCLFPNISSNMLQDINLREMACLFPDLSSLKSLTKVSYRLSYININVNRIDGVWFSNKNAYSKENIPINYDFISMFDNNLLVGRNGIFVFLPSPLEKYTYPAQAAKTIDIVEIGGIAKELFILDTNNSIWKCRIGDNEFKQIDSASNKVHIEILYGRNPKLAGIDTNGIVHKCDTTPTMQLFNSGEGKLNEPPNIVSLFGSICNALAVTNDGKLIEISEIFTRFEKIKIITDLPLIVSAATFITSKFAKKYGICVDENGKLWVKQFPSAAKKDVGLEEWQMINIPSTFVKVIHQENVIIFLTKEAEVMIYKIDTVENLEGLINGNLPKLPIFCNHNWFSNKKSARK